MKYNEKVERCAPKLGRKNLANGLSCPPFVYMDDSDDGMWVHYVKYCENIAKQKFKRCLAMARWCRMHDEFTQLESERLGLPQRTLFLEYRRKAMWWNKWRKRWLELAEKFKDAK